MMISGKLRSTSGESIAETLVAVLIAALALLMLAGTINSSSHIITSSKEKLEEYYAKNNILAVPNGSTISRQLEIEINDTAGKVQDKWEDAAYNNLTSDDSSIVGDKELISYWRTSSIPVPAS